MAKIHTLKILNYRGIQKFEQVFGMADFICIIGRGDSGKSTILEAISAVLSPSWNLTFYDTDFYNIDINLPIEIEASLYDFPKSLIQESKYGLYIRGLDKGTQIIHDDIKDEHEPVLTIKLKVEKDLEPKWLVVNEREGQDNIEIRANDRASLNVFLVSDFIDRHFSWNKGNPLFSLFKEEDAVNEKTNVLIEAFREAKESINPNSFKHLEGVVNRVKAAASTLGVNIIDTNTTIDFKDISIKDGRISLHANKIPFRQKGKGSKRLISIAIQTELAKSGGILLIDEVEQALEPDRAKHLVKTLKNQKHGQVFITTHSRDVLVELQADNIFLMNQNRKNLIEFDGSFQGCLRKNPEAFFANKIIVCEGATEVGICRSINEFRIKENQLSNAILGIAIVDGTGANFVHYCEKFNEAGFKVSAFCDSDDPAINAKKPVLFSQSIKIFDCEDGNAIEQQIFLDVPWEDVQKLIEYAIEQKDELTVKQAIINQFQNELPVDWFESENLEIRIAIARASSFNKKKESGVNKEKGWFKRTDHGEFIGEICCNSLSKMNGKKLKKQFDELSYWLDHA